MTSIVRATAKAVLPLETRDRLRSMRANLALRRMSADPIDLGAAERIRERTPAELADPRVLEHEVLPAAGINAELVEEYEHPLLPDDLVGSTGHGLLFWQYPNQFAPYLQHLARYPVRSYLEVGVRHGGTFVVTVEVLRKLTGLERAVAVDISDAPSLREYTRTAPGTSFVQTSSTSRAFRRLVHEQGPFDVVLIDGDHTEHAVRGDFEVVRDHANIVVLHDIVTDTAPGVANVWRELQRTEGDTYEFFEFAAQYPQVVERMGSTWLGLGVAVRRDFAPTGLAAAETGSATTGA